MGSPNPDQISVDSLITWSDSVTLRGGQHKVFDAVIMRNPMVFGMTIPRKSLLFDNVVYMAFFGISNRCRKAKLS